MKRVVALLSVQTSVVTVELTAERKDNDSGMSLRSQHSVQSVNAPSAVSFNDSAVYQAALRVAYLVHLLATSAQSSTANDVRSADVKLSNRQSDGSWSNALYSIGDLFKSE